MLRNMQIRCKKQNRIISAHVGGFLLFTRRAKNDIIYMKRRCIFERMYNINRRFSRSAKGLEKSMRNRDYGKILVNATGTMFLIASVFFVCSTVLSMRAVLAEVMPQMNIPQYQTAASPRTSNTSARTTASPRTTTTSSRALVSRASVAPTASTTSRAATTATASRAAATSGSVNSRAASTANSNVVARSVSPRTTSTNSNVNASRSVVSRVAAASPSSVSRVSLSGDAIRSTTGVTYTYATTSSSLYNTSVSNIIDSTTGLISADAYSNCMESYYTCMDEICTARSAAQRRCACAGRVKEFAAAEDALEQSNEELIKVSGEIALLVASGGKDVSAAFQLTDAEKVMNCVSWQEANKNDTWSDDERVEWCNEHGMFGTACPADGMPTYCEESGNNFGFNVDNLDASGSNILAQLQSWADAKDSTITIINETNTTGFDLFDDLDISSLPGLGTVNTDEVADYLAETWGYDLFGYAHNNVCNRVLDSCFNGIYEACGTPSGSQNKCSNGANTCPFNYNSDIIVDGDNVEFVTPNTSTVTSSTPACYGYTTGTDPYAQYREPIADARRSIMQKYVLDANADCDVYGEQLRTTAQNISYQKVAAQQALQEMRLEFKLQEEEDIYDTAIAAIDNYNECVAEIFDCYEANEDTEGWSTSRVKTYCMQMSNAPSCYETMICKSTRSPFYGVVDKMEATDCVNSQEYETNTCRNVVTLNEILNGVDGTTITDWDAFIPGLTTTNSADIRESCLRETLGVETLNDPSIRSWEKTP